MSNAVASPVFTDTGEDTSLAIVLDGLTGHDGKDLVLTYEDGQGVRAGYHVTEVKAGSFATLDCGGNPDAWRETVLQVEDLPASEDTATMSVGKFRSILAKVATKVPLDPDSRLTLEVSRPEEAMRIYDVAGIEADTDRVVMRLAPRPATCKPRHRAAAASAAFASAAACCDPPKSDKGAACCA